MAGREDIFNKAMNDGHSAAWDQNWEQAARAYLQALGEFPNSPKALSSYALAQYQLQNFDEALKAYIRFARVAPEDPLGFEKIAQINEHKGQARDAVQAALYAAELYIKLHDVDKAMENWITVLRLNPENLQARSRLGLIHEKTGQTRQATIDYIAVASILQNSGNPQKAIEFLKHAGQLDPGSAELKHAVGLVRAGKMLPKPSRPKGGTAPLVMPTAPKKLASTAEAVQDGPDPVVEARQKALKAFADVLFDMEDDSGESSTRRGLAEIEKNTAEPDLQAAEHSKMLLHLSEVINAQSRENDVTALDELEHAIGAGFNHPAAYFDVGLLLSRTDQQESALRNLQQTYKHNDYALAARLLSGKILHGLKRDKQAASEYLEALKLADVAVIADDQVETILRLYEPLIEMVGNEKDAGAQVKLCENVDEMLMRTNWRQHLKKLRSEMANSDGQSLPIAEILIQAQSSQVIEAMREINAMARNNHLRSAMDEAFHALIQAPTYLPLHILMADLLIQDGRQAEAITKLNTVVDVYTVRAGTSQAIALLRRVVQLAPMDLGARNHLIELLSENNQTSEAIKEYLDLADIYYRLAELEMARKTFAGALRLSQQTEGNNIWSVKIMQRMADIDMQRLDWRQAIQVYEQIRSLAPEDLSVWENLIGMHLRLGDVSQAQAELETLIGNLDKSNPVKVLPFLQNLVDEHPEQAMLRQAFAARLYKNGLVNEAVAQLELVADKLLEEGDQAGMAGILNQIILMNPPNVDQYRVLLAKLKY